jgi:hypothetical protein
MVFPSVAEGVKSANDSLTSGTRTVMPIDRHSARYSAVLSLSSRKDVSSARQVLNGIVGLEPRVLIGDQRVAVGVRLVEGVIGEGLDIVKESLAELAAVASCLGTH